jgi:hypothetical protein
LDANAAIGGMARERTPARLRVFDQRLGHTAGRVAAGQRVDAPGAMRLRQGRWRLRGTKRGHGNC